ncbi:hypothetical protein [Micromonospora sp. DT62]|uniref:hypothetical protein n=1 Tax=Micromonospora sp. DT62 TaxID=3416521 RepID=UPI003CEBA5F7
MSLDGYIAGPGAPFTFVTEGVEAAVARARELAGERWVAVNGGSIARQCLAAGLLDEIRVDPTVVEGDRVTHLYYRVRRR